MWMHLALGLGAVFALSPLDGIAGEKQIVDVKELAGSWRGWVMGVQGEERATMIVTANGSYRATTTPGSTTEVSSIFKTANCDTARRERQGRRVFPKTKASLCSQ